MLKWVARAGLALSLVLSGYEIVPRALDALSLFGIRHDPTAMLLYRLRDLDGPAYATEIEAALAADDAELARSLADLATDRGIRLEDTLIARIGEAERFSLSRSAAQLWSGAVSGKADSPVAFAGALASDLTVVGDIRDLGQQSMLYPDQDNLTVALAATGIVMTAALVVSGGTSAAGKAGVSALKAARKLGRLSTGLERQLIRLTAEAVDSRAIRSLASDLRGWNFTAAANSARRLIKPDVLDELVDTGDAVRHVFARQGYRGTLQVLETAQDTGDIRKIRRMSDHLGGKFRAALFLKRGASLTLDLAELVLAVGAWLFSAALWLLWAGYTVIRMAWKLGRFVAPRAVFLIRREPPALASGTAASPEL
jgi:hypothetical protein